MAANRVTSGRGSWTWVVLLAAVGLGAGMDAAALEAVAEPRRADTFDRRFPPRRPPPDAGPPADPMRAVTLPSGFEPADCGDLAADERLSCPLVQQVRRTRPIRGGVRLVLDRRDPRASAAVIRRVLSCQVAMLKVRPELPAPCPFLGQGVDFLVRSRNGQVLVDLVLVDDRIGPGVLRERVQTALGAAGR